MDLNIIDKANMAMSAQAENLKNKDLKDACSQFESFFINEILKSARKSCPKEGLFGKSQGMEVYQSMLDMELSNNMSKKGLGIGKVLYSQLSKMPTE